MRGQQLTTDDGRPLGGRASLPSEQPEYVQLKSNADFSFVSPPYAGIVRSLLPTNPPGPRGTVDVN